MHVDDLTVLVVGGTGDSGQAVVETVADAGGTVGFTYDSSVDAAERLRDDHDVAGAWRCDVTDPDEVDRVVDRAFADLGRIDGLVYTVGVIDRGRITETDDATWQSHLDANVTGAFNAIRAAGPRFVEQGRGAIVALAASEGILRAPDLAAYDASKAGLVALVQEAARELGPGGVRANVVSPGFIRDPGALSAEATEDILEQLPYDHVTTPRDVANACLFLCSDAAASITGAVLPVDSGLALE